MSDSISDIPPPSDSNKRFAEMVARAQEGDKEAINSFIAEYGLYNGPVFRYILYMVGNNEIARDLYHDLVCRVHEKIHKTDERLRDKNNAKSWIFTIATNLARDHERCKQSHIKKTLSLDTMMQNKDELSIQHLNMLEEQISTISTEEEVVSEETSIEKQKLDRKRLKLVSEALERIPLGQKKEAFRQRHILDLSYEEIAQNLEITESTARSYVSRTLKSIRHRIWKLIQQERGIS